MVKCPSCDLTFTASEEREVLARTAAARRAQEQQEPTDDQLAAKGDWEAVSVLYKRYAPTLLPFLASRARDYEDLHQELWLRVKRALPGGFQGGNFQAWLFTIARNLVAEGGRGPSPPGPLPDSIPDGQPQAITMIVEQEEKAVLDHHVDRLDPLEAAVVRGRLAGESYDDLSLRLKISKPEAYKLLHGAKQTLQGLLAEKRLSPEWWVMADRGWNRSLRTHIACCRRPGRCSG